MVRSVSIAALILSAGLATTAFAASETKNRDPEVAPVAAPSKDGVKAEAVAAPAPAAAKSEPGPVTAMMNAQASENAPPPPAPAAPPLAAPSTQVAAEPLQPAAKPVLRASFAAPPAGIVAVSTAKAEQTPEPVQVSNPPAPVPQAVASPAPAAAASALVARRITDAAGAFDAWTEKAARIDGKFSDAKGVAGALTDATAFQAQQLEEGAVAYGALAALQNPVFVQSAKELASLGGDRDAAADVLLKNPLAVMALPGADGAAAFVADSIAKRAKAALAAGKAVKQAAYTVQANPWAKEPIAGADKRLAEAKARSASIVALDGPASVILMKRLVELRTSRPIAAGGSGEPMPLVARSLALATMIVLGEADEAHGAKVAPLLIEAKSTDCLKMAKLNLFQCLSVAGPQYEDVFCVGQHGLAEPAQCLTSAVGASASTPEQAAAPVLLAAAPAPVIAGVAVPIALLAESGPERSAAYAAPVAIPPAAPQQLAQVDPAPVTSDAPAWSRESIARAPERDPDAPTLALRQPAPRDEAPAFAPRADRGLAYRWDRQTRAAGYDRQPAYDPRQPQAYDGADDRYADPRDSYGRYGQQRRQPVDAYGRPDADDDDDGPAGEDRTLAPAYAPNQWGMR